MSGDEPSLERQNRQASNIIFGVESVHRSDIDHLRESAPGQLRTLWISRVGGRLCHVALPSKCKTSAANLNLLLAYLGQARPEVVGRAQSTPAYMALE